jgi:hypothetical protein
MVNGADRSRPLTIIYSVIFGRRPKQTAGTNSHAAALEPIEAVGDPPFCQIIRRHFHPHFIAGKYADAVLHQFAGDYPSDYRAVCEFNSDGLVTDKKSTGGDCLSVQF